MSDIANTLRTITSYGFHKFPAGGWVWHGVPFRMQRTDQGQDFEIPLHHNIIAPGPGYCTNWLSDGPFPNGFGSPYAVVRITKGRFGGRHWYLGHANHVYVKPGEHFRIGQPLARLDNSLHAGWGWAEIGYAPGGSPGPMGTGAQFHDLFRPLWRWSN